MDLFDLFKEGKDDGENIQEEKDIKETKSNETNIVSESASNVENTESVTNSNEVSDTENTKNTESNNSLIRIENMQDDEAMEGEIIEETEFDRCSNALDNSSYVIVTDFPCGNKAETRLCKITKKEIIPLTNFLPIITDKIKYINGEDTSIKYKLKAFVLDKNNKETETIEIDEGKFSKLTHILDTNWTGDIIFHEGCNDKRLKEVIQTIAKVSMKERTIYTNTGFVEINGKKRYLYHGGSIGEDEDNNIETDLSECSLQQYHITDKEFDVIESLKLDYSLLEVGEFKIMVVLIATIFLSPLTSMLQEIGIFINYLLLLIGKTGTYKSTITALMLSHFGDFEFNTFPLSFDRSTFVSVEKVAYILKDNIANLDDYKPEKEKTDQDKTMEGILGLWGDRHSRMKMKADGNLHKKYEPRGIGMATAEILPNLAQSRLARAMAVYTKEGSIDIDKHNVIHKQKEKLQYTMKHYIKWIISNEDEIKAKAKKLQSIYYDKTRELSVHPRIKQNIVVMMIGFALWLDFMEEYSIIDTNKSKELLEKSYIALEEIGEEQGENVEDVNPVKTFFNILSQLQIDGKVYFEDYKTGLAVDGVSGTQIGFIDNDTNQYYLKTDKVYEVVSKSCVNSFITTPNQLWKSLADEGYTVRHKDSYTYKGEKKTIFRKTIRKTDPKTKLSVDCIVIPKQKWNEVMGQD